MSRPRKSAADKVVSRERLAGILAAPRAAGRRVVFTNGCYDLLHAGHLRLLEAAAALGDVLVVGLNSDASVRRLKGENRPLLPFEERALLLAGLEVVDWVVGFEEDTPLALIGAVLPDVLVKGGDWAPERIVGRDIVESRGGRVVTVPLLHGRSTTALVDAILERHAAGRGREDAGR